MLPFDLDTGGCRWTTPGWGTGHLALQEIEEPSGCPGGYRRRRQRTAWAGCLQALSALRHPVAGGMCLSLLLQHLLYLPCPIGRGSRCVWHRSVQKSLLSSPNQICPSSIDPSAGPLAMSRYAMALLMPKSSPAAALRLGAVCVVVTNPLEEVALNAKAA